MSHFGLSIYQHNELRRRMRKNHIFEKDLKESFVRSSGPGGQNVNKVSTCVMLFHVPTGIQVKCQSERTQKANRYKARVILINKIERKNKAEQLKRAQDKAKKRRQNRKRSALSKEKMLEQKKKQSEKKSLRQKIRPSKMDL